MDTSQIILASGSPRRLDILRAHGVEPEVVLACLDEDALAATLTDTLSPEELAEQLAVFKAQAVFEQLKALGRNTEDCAILAADTIVVRGDDDILGKPKTRDEAVSMLESLENTEHRVITGVALIRGSSGEQTRFHDTTLVRFGAYSLQDIEDYLTSEPPFDKAGSYAIQGMWGKHVAAIEGDLENVIGLPYHRLKNLL